MSSVTVENRDDIDRLFAQRLLPQGPPAAANFLAYLLKMAREGHICVPLMGLDPPLIEGAHQLPPSLFEEYIVQQKGAIYLRRNWDCEQKFLAQLERLRAVKPKHPIDIERLNMARLNSEQQEALRKAAHQTVTLITGGPGSGKTYTAAILIEEFIQQGIKEVAVAAPTGKAAANLRIALGATAQRCTIKTLHGLLKRGHLYAELIVVDEGSMIDAEMMASLFGAIDEGSRLVLLGDNGQLPPVESGHFFSDLAENPLLTAPLRLCLRTELREIIEWAQKAKIGEMIPHTPLPPLKELIPKILEKKVTVLTPLRSGPYGVDNLNRLLFQEYKNRKWHEVPIIIRVNAPSLGLYNGDIGIWDQRDHRVFFPSIQKSYAETLLPYYEYAYVLSVHQSQGSEYDRVLILIPTGAETFSREMLYTAITRAKKEVEIYADPMALDLLLKSRSHRNSGINYRLSNDKEEC